MSVERLRCECGRPTCKLHVSAWRGDRVVLLVDANSLDEVAAVHLAPARARRLAELLTREADFLDRTAARRKRDRLLAKGDPLRPPCGATPAGGDGSAVCVMGRRHGGLHRAADGTAFRRVERRRA